jgi:hypothetical protein
LGQQKFRGLIEMGHKGPAVCYPFDPAAAWGPHARFFVRGTLNGCRFEGEIGYRRRRFYTLLDDELLGAAGLSPDDVADVVVELRVPRPEELAEKPNLTWGRLAVSSTSEPASKSTKQKASTSSKRVPLRRKTRSQGRVTQRKKTGKS